MANKKASKTQEPAATPSIQEYQKEQQNNSTGTLYKQLTDWTRELKSSSTGKIESDQVIKKIDEFCSNKMNVDINTGKEVISFEALNQKQVDCISSMFEAYKNSIEEKNKEMTSQKNNGFEAVAVKWPEENVPQPPVVSPTEDCGCGDNKPSGEIVEVEVKPKKKRTKKEKPA